MSEPFKITELVPWSQNWDLPTIPDKEFNSEHGRRNAAKRKVCRGPLKLRTCQECGEKMPSREFEGHINPRTGKHRVRRLKP